MQPAHAINCRNASQEKRAAREIRLGHSALQDLEKETPRGAKGTISRKRWLQIGAASAVVFAIVITFIIRNWPFKETNVVKQLEETTSSKVHFLKFQKVFFPHPGCIAYGVTLERGEKPGEQQRMTIEKLEIVGTLAGLFTKHLAVIRVQKAHVYLPRFGTSPSWTPTQSDIVVDELIADNAMLEFARRDLKTPPFAIAVHEFVAHHLASGDAMQFNLRAHNPTPPGEVQATGNFGPWKMDQIQATPLSGTYSFRQADLGVFEGIRGILAADGDFRGTLESIAVNGVTRTPAFQVEESTHTIDLNTNFQATVNPSNGDVSLQKVLAQLSRTGVTCHGTIKGEANTSGKTTSLNFDVRSGRIQDLFLPFISEKKSPVNGTVSLKAKAVVPPGKEPFLKKLRMTGDFGIESALFSKEETQTNLEKLSEAARGQADKTDDPEDVVSNLSGHVVVRNGIATFSELRFEVPGARATLQGTYNLLTQKIDLRGMLYMDANLPKATSGIKSFLLKAIDPFLKKNRQGGAKIPVKITGNYQHPSYSSDPV